MYMKIVADTKMFVFVVIPFGPDQIIYLISKKRLTECLLKKKTGAAI